MENKKGIVRIIEAFLAIFLILGTVTVVYYNHDGKNYENQNIIETEKLIMNQIATNDQLRAEVLSMNENSTLSANLNNTITSKLLSRYDFEFKVCEINSVCSATKYHGTVYAYERLISSTLEIYSPKKMKIYIWPKNEL